GRRIPDELGHAHSQIAGGNAVRGRQRGVHWIRAVEREFKRGYGVFVDTFVGTAHMQWRIAPRSKPPQYFFPDGCVFTDRTRSQILERQACGLRSLVVACRAVSLEERTENGGNVAVSRLRRVFAGTPRCSALHRG